MAGSIKTEKEIDSMRRGGKILARIVKELSNFVKVGISTYDIDNLSLDLCEKFKVIPAFYKYQGYPANACIGVNDTVVHGIPSKEEILKEGDILSIDYGVIYEGLYTDMAVSVGVGNIAENAAKMIKGSKEALFAGIEVVKEGNTIGDIGNAIETTAQKYGFSVVKMMVGHSVGRKLHEEPFIPGYGKPGTGMELKAGMTLAIEAIINEGNENINFLEDKWTTKTADGKLSAMFEHTVLVTEKKGEILTII